MTLRTHIKRLLADDRGATAIEYGLILALISIGLVGAAAGLAGARGILWETILDNVLPIFGI
jgi:pilus assembly protein Flp/PilA